MRLPGRFLYRMRGARTARRSYLALSGLVAHRGGFGAGLAGLALARVCLALPLDTGRLVVLAALRLREQPVLLDLAGKLLQGLVERLALFDQNLSHSCTCYLDGDTDLSSSLLSSRLKNPLRRFSRWWERGPSAGTHPNPVNYIAYHIVAHLASSYFGLFWD